MVESKPQVVSGLIYVQVHVCVSLFTKILTHLGDFGVLTGLVLFGGSWRLEKTAFSEGGVGDGSQCCLSGRR